MCGIVGMVAKLPSGFYDAHSTLFEEMLVADSLRGVDSTGAFQVSRVNHVRAIKHDTNPFNLLNTPQWNDFAKSIRADALITIGHNRAATKGNVTNNNAHPFIEGHIALVHNGTLYSHKELADVEVDSQAIAIAIKEKGWREVLPKLHGAFALAWYDQKEQALYLTTNGQRPLGYIETENHWLIGSEVGMLHWLAGRNDMKRPKDGKVGYIAKNQMIRIVLSPSIKIEHIDLDEEFKHLTQVETRPPFPTTSGTKDTTTASGNSLTTGLAKLVELYPRSAPVIVIIGDVVKAYEDGDRGVRWAWTGEIYQPGKPYARARGYLPSNIHTADDAADLGSELRLVGEVSAHMQEDLKDYVLIKDIKTDTWLATYGKSDIIQTEWKMLVEQVPCSLCGEALREDFPGFTSVVREKDNKYVCICDECITKDAGPTPLKLGAFTNASE